MYKSPIEIIHSQIRTQLEDDVLKAVQRYGINVNKEELIKDLRYDRQQYKKGYEDAKAEQKKGEWIPQDFNKRTGCAVTAAYYFPRCSECGYSGDYEMNYCPNCGADMRGEEE